MKAKEWREKSEGERGAELTTLRDAVRTFRFDVATRQVKNHRGVRAAKKDIARILTLRRESEAGAA